MKMPSVRIRYPARSRFLFSSPFETDKLLGQRPAAKPLFVSCLFSSVVEHFLGTEKVVSSILTSGSLIKKRRAAAILAAFVVCSGQYFITIDVWL
jgi:hypothetical protein